MSDERAMMRKLLAHEQELAAIVEVFEKDNDLVAISPNIEFPAEPNKSTTTKEAFMRSQDTLKALNIQWAHGNRFAVRFFDHSSVLGSMAYGYYYVNSPGHEKLPSLPDLSYKRISKLGYDTYYKHIKGNWYLYAEYREW